MKNKTINANGVEIRLYGNVVNEEAYISLTDIAKYKNSDDPRIVISNWMSSYSTIDYLAMWRGFITLILTVWNSRRLEVSREDWL